MRDRTPVAAPSVTEMVRYSTVAYGMVWYGSYVVLCYVMVELVVFGISRTRLQMLAAAATFGKTVSRYDAMRILQ